MFIAQHLPNFRTKSASLRFFLLLFSLFGIFFGESFGITAAAAEISGVATFEWPSTNSWCELIVVTFSMDGEASFLLFGLDFLPSFFTAAVAVAAVAAAAAAIRPMDSSRCFLISKSSFGWIFSKLLRSSVVPLVLIDLAADAFPLVDLLTRILEPGGLVALFLRTAWLFNFPVDSWRYTKNGGTKQNIPFNLCVQTTHEMHFWITWVHCMVYLECNGIGVGGDDFSFTKFHMQFWLLNCLIQLGTAIRFLIAFDCRCLRFWWFFLSFIAVSIAILAKKEFPSYCIEGFVKIIWLKWWNVWYSRNVRCQLWIIVIARDANKPFFLLHSLSLHSSSSVHTIFQQIAVFLLTLLRTFFRHAIVYWHTKANKAIPEIQSRSPRILEDPCCEWMTN